MKLYDHSLNISSSFFLLHQPSTEYLTNIRFYFRTVVDHDGIRCVCEFSNHRLWIRSPCWLINGMKAQYAHTPHFIVSRHLPRYSTRPNMKRGSLEIPRIYLTNPRFRICCEGAYEKYVRSTFFMTPPPPIFAFQIRKVAIIIMGSVCIFAHTPLSKEHF